LIGTFESFLSSPNNCCEQQTLSVAAAAAVVDAAVEAVKTGSRCWIVVVAEDIGTSQAAVAAVDTSPCCSAAAAPAERVPAAAVSVE